MRALIERAAIHVAAFKDKWVANGYPDYPLWVPTLIHALAGLAALFAVLQRPAADALPALALMAGAFLPWVLELRGRVAPLPTYVVTTLACCLVLAYRYPVDYDISLAILVIFVGHYSATENAVRSSILLFFAAIVVLVLGLSATLPMAAVGLWLAAVLGGWDIGFILRYQQLKVDDSERRQDERERLAISEERRRIAREVHDLVAHSLSVTMLHLTAARRDLEDDGELAEAIAALQDAERVGRQAMADIRQAVGVLGAAEQPQGSVPVLSDLPALVDDFRSAGLDVDLGLEGDLDDVPSSTALALYRIVQESLANVAKHAPGSRVLVRLDLTGAAGVLSVRNAVPRGAVRSTDGVGLRGMSERADQIGARFSAGVEDRLWTVRVVLPRGETEGRGLLGPACPLPRLIVPRRWAWS